MAKGLHKTLGSGQSELFWHSKQAMIARTWDVSSSGAAASSWDVLSREMTETHVTGCKNSTRPRITYNNNNESMTFAKA